MKWVFKEMKAGDMVRVQSGSFYHYGICIDDDTVIQFGESVVNPTIDPDTVVVNQTDIGDFLRGRFAEVAEYDKKELKRKNSPEQIVKYAKSSIGKKGYHILYNNCEHFANECVFNDHACSQTDDFRNKFGKSFPMIDVYISEVNRFLDFKKLPKYAKAELKKLKNESVSNQKKCAYGLLEYALKNTFNKEYNPKNVYKDKRGKPKMDELYLSVSHTSELVCVAISKYNIGVDIEKIAEHKSLDPIKNHILSENEQAENMTFEDVLSLWTKKEAIYKFDDGIESYVPTKIDTSKYQVKTVKLNYNEETFIISVSADSVVNVNFLPLDGKIQ